MFCDSRKASKRLARSGGKSKSSCGTSSIPFGNGKDYSQRKRSVRLQKETLTRNSQDAHRTTLMFLFPQSPKNIVSLLDAFGEHKTSASLTPKNPKGPRFAESNRLVEANPVSIKVWTDWSWMMRRNSSFVMAFGVQGPSKASGERQ